MIPDADIFENFKMQLVTAWNDKDYKLCSFKYVMFDDLSEVRKGRMRLIVWHWLSVLWTRSACRCYAGSRPGPLDGVKRSITSHSIAVAVLCQEGPDGLMHPPSAEVLQKKRCPLPSLHDRSFCLGFVMFKSRDFRPVQRRPGHDYYSLLACRAHLIHLYSLVTALRTLPPPMRACGCKQTSEIQTRDDLFQCRLGTPTRARRAHAQWSVACSTRVLLGIL